MIEWGVAIGQLVLFIAAAPLLGGWIKRVKCHLQNRAAPSLLQPYRDLAKLFRKHSVIATNASWLFRATPYIVFGATIVTAAVVPLLALPLPTAAVADVIVLAGFLALARFFTALAGMDIGTAFGGNLLGRRVAHSLTILGVFVAFVISAMTLKSVATDLHLLFS